MIAFKYGIDKVKLGENRNNIKYIYRKSSIASLKHSRWTEEINEQNENISILEETQMHMR